MGAAFVLARRRSSAYRLPPEKQQQSVVRFSEPGLAAGLSTFARAADIHHPPPQTIHTLVILCVALRFCLDLVRVRLNTLISSPLAPPSTLSCTSVSSWRPPLLFTVFAEQTT